MNTLISVIICTYNRCKSLAETLKSFQLQECDDSFDYEIIVVDNSSKDKTKEVVEEFQSQMDDKLQYVFEDRQGKSYALNTGIKKAKGEILAFTDDDVIVDKRWLVEIYKIFRKGDYKGGGGKVLPVWPNKVPSWLGPEYTNGPIVSHDIGNEEKEYDNKMPSPIGANMFFRKVNFEKYDFFRTDLGRVGNSALRGEDIEFCERLRKNKEIILYVPNAIVYHPVDSIRINKNYFRQWFFNDGRYRARMAYESLPGTICYFGIPRYLFKLLIKDLLKSFVYIFHNEKKSFYYHLKTICALGEMFEYFNINYKRRR